MDVMAQAVSTLVYTRTDNIYAPIINPKRRTMENDCSNLYDGRLCYLTFHKHERALVGYVCAYPHNCKECKDYKSKEKIQ